MPSPESRYVPQQEVKKKAPLPAFSEADWDISPDEQQVLADTKITATESNPPVTERTRTPRRKNIDGTRRTADQMLAELKQSIEASNDDALYARQMELEKKEAFGGNISEYEKKELQSIIERQQTKRDAKELEMIEDLITRIDATSASKTSTKELAPPTQATVPTPKPRASFFGKVASVFQSIGSFFSRNKIDQAMKEMESMTDEQVTADVQAAAATERATRESKAERYATTLEAGPSTVRKVTTAVGDTYVAGIDALQSIGVPKGVDVTRLSDDEIDERDEKVNSAPTTKNEAAAIREEARQLQEYEDFVTRYVSGDVGMTRNEAIIAEIIRLNQAVEENNIPKDLVKEPFNTATEQLDYVLNLLPNDVVRNADKRTKAGMAIDKARKIAQTPSIIGRNTR